VTPNPGNSSTVHYCFVGSVDLLEPARDVDNVNNVEDADKLKNNLINFM
jgi:hypothetical protein